MLRLDADAPKPPTYPFKSKFSKSVPKDKNVKGASFLACPCQPHLQIFRISASFRLMPSLRFLPSPSRFRFGEAVFTEVRRKPQEGKMRNCELFSICRIYLQNLGLGEIFSTTGAALRQ
jgi:hypothetical protein